MSLFKSSLSIKNNDTTCLKMIIFLRNLFVSTALTKQKEKIEYVSFIAMIRIFSISCLGLRFQMLKKKGEHILVVI